MATNKRDKPAQEAIKQTIEQAIAKTGYVLEHKVASLFEKANWSVIHNRYYLDDVTESQREMDMIAYKSFLNKDGIRIYTALIISCKKNDEFDWVFLTRDAPSMSLNINMLPINFFSNIEEFNHEISHINWERKSFIEKYDQTKIIDSMYNYDRIVFAYQEIKKANNAASNDTNIFNSISSLIKAQSFELNSLKEGRKKLEKVVYNVNLLSIADLAFHELHYNDDRITTSSISRINYLNRFLINTRESHSRIDFINFNTLSSVIDEYDKLHEWNKNFHEKLYKDFFDNVFNDYRKRKVVIDKIKGQLFDYIGHFLPYSPVPNFTFSFFGVEKAKDIVSINITDITELNTFFNSHSAIKSFTKNLLKDYFKYSGKFKFEEELLPF